MIENDTIELLKECDSGIEIGVASIDDSLKYVGDKELKQRLDKCKAEHERLRDEVQSYLLKYRSNSPENTEKKLDNTNPMAMAMSRLKTNTRLTLNSSDETVADLLTDGCDMGVKSLCRYLNKYKAADEKAKDFTKRLVRLEDKLREDLRQYL